MKRIGKIAFATLLVTGLGVQAYAVSTGKSFPLAASEVETSNVATTADATQLVFSLDEIEPELSIEPVTVDSVIATEEAIIADAADEELAQCDSCGTGGSVISDTVISESYVAAPSVGYAPACSTCGTSGGFLSSGGGGFAGGGGAGGAIGGSGFGRLALIGAAVAIPLAVSDDDDDVVAYPAGMAAN